MAHLRLLSLWLVSLSAISGVSGTAAHSAGGAASATTRPNFIVVMMDDLDLLLNGTAAMPTFEREFVRGGLGLKGFVDVPICCPSRTSTLSGLYAHNLNDTALGWCGNFYANHAGRTWINDLRLGGYQTGLFGKMTNDYSDFCGPRVRRFDDFDEALILCNDNVYFANTWNHNGVMERANNLTYMTNTIGNASLAWLEMVVANKSAPFFAYIAPHAPHVPATPAHEYENAPLPNGPLAPRTPSWNYATQHHHWLVSEKAPLTDALINFSDELYARRLRSTMSVDDILSAVFDLLARNDALASTYVLFTSDHGYDLGTFRLPSGKFQVFENVLRVPFAIRGPNVSAGVDLSTTLVNNVDIAPTILELAGVTSSRVLDGRSFASQLTAESRASTPWTRDRLLHEYYGMGYTERGPCHNGTTACPGGPQALEDAPSNTWSGLRIVNSTHDIVYAEYRGAPSDAIIASNTNFTLAFNMTADPFQLVNSAMHWDAAFLAQLSAELWQVATCAGAQCP